MRLHLTLAVALLGGCADYDMSAGADTDAYAGDDAPEADADADSDSAPPEQEDDFLALKPAETDVYVFIANPSRDTVTRVNVTSLAVDTTPVGDDPRVVLTSPDWSTAVVFNRGDDSVTILDADTLVAVDVGVRDNFNQMVMSPDGRYVAVWHDIAAEEPDDPEPEGVQSYNEISFVDVADAEHFPMAVGFNPKEVQFTPDGSLAVVVSDEYLALVDLTAETPSPDLIQVADDLTDPPAAEEVILAPDGSYAFVRQFGASDLAVVDLTERTVTRIPVGQNPTDMDVTPDGEHAVVVARGSREVWRFDIDDPFAVPEVLALPGEAALGSVLFDPTGRVAVLYTTASLTDRWVSWDLATDTLVERSFVKPIDTIAVTPTGESLLVFHTLEDADDADPTTPFYGEWALTLVDLDDFRTNPLKLPAEPIGYANSNNGNYGYFIMDGEPYLEVLVYDTLLYEQIELRSEPVYVGVLPDLDTGDGDEPPAWASQEHDLGRISFFDPDDGSVETITGFELNAEIED